MARKIKTFDYNDTFPRRLRELVDERKDITQERIAELVGATRQTVGNWCSGKSAPDAIALSKIAREFNVSIDWLLQEDAPKQVNATLASVCKYTGLTEGAVEVLHGFKLASMNPHIVNGITYKSAFNWIDVDDKDSKAVLAYLSRAIETDTLAKIWVATYKAASIDAEGIEKIESAETDEQLHAAMGEADKKHTEAELERYHARIELDRYFEALIASARKYEEVIGEAERRSCSLNKQKKVL